MKNSFRGTLIAEPYPETGWDSAQVAFTFDEADAADLGPVVVRVLDKRSFVAPDLLGTCDLDWAAGLPTAGPPPPGEPWLRDACLDRARPAAATLEPPAPHLWLASEKIRPPTLSVVVRVFQGDAAPPRESLRGSMI